MRRRDLFAYFSCIFFVFISATLADNYELARTCRPLDRALDILVILDGSGSTGGSTFDTQISMLMKIVDSVQFGPENAKLAVLQYSSYTKVEFYFNQFQTREEYKEAISEIRYMAGTTRTGKALQKATEVFSEQHGARLNRKDVVQVVVVVSDGHSQDDPAPSAEALRAEGIIVLAVGIGDYVNTAELLEMALDKDHVFVDGSLEQFEQVFKKIAIGQLCTYAKGPRGAEISCGPDYVQISVLTRKSFQGHLYIKNKFDEPSCSVRALVRDGQFSNEILMRIPLTSCGIQAQFVLNPNGLLFEATAILMFHEEFSTEKDEAFNIRCFFPDSQYGVQNLSEIRRLNDPSQISEDSAWQEARMTALESAFASSNIPQMKAQCLYKIQKKQGCILDNLNVGDKLLHFIDCQSVGDLRQNYVMFVHTCYMTDGQSLKKLILDSDGCPIDPAVMSAVVYKKQFLAQIETSAVKFPDKPTLKFSCLVKFCNTQTTDCEEITMFQCPSTAEMSSRKKREISSGKISPRRFLDRLLMNHDLNFVNIHSNNEKAKKPVRAFPANYTSTLSLNETKKRSKSKLRRQIFRNSNFTSNLHKKSRNFTIAENSSTAANPINRLPNLSGNKRLWKIAMKGINKQLPTTEKPQLSAPLENMQITDKPVFEDYEYSHANLTSEVIGLNSTDYWDISAGSIDPQLFFMEGLSSSIESTLKTLDQVALESQMLIINEIDNPDDLRTVTDFCPNEKSAEPALR